MNNRCSIASFPKKNHADAYLELFYNELSKNGFDYLGEIQFSVKWFLTTGSKIDIYHIHWPESMWRQYIPRFQSLLLKKNIFGSYFAYRKLRKIYELLGVVNFFFLLTIAKLKNKLILWTCHNIEPHEKPSLLDRYAYHLLAKVSDKIIVHGNSAFDGINKIYSPRCEVINMNMGNFKDYYPVPGLRQHIFKKYDLKHDLPVVSCIGNIREYKGIDLACKAVLPINKKINFIIAGRPSSDFNMEPLIKLVSKMENATIINHFLNDQEISDLFSITDIVMMPYKKITGSAIILNALTFGASVVTSDLPFFSEILDGNENAGVVVKGKEANDYTKAILNILKIDKDERCRLAFHISEQYNWSDVIKPVIESIGYR